MPPKIFTENLKKLLDEENKRAAQIVRLYDDFRRNFFDLISGNSDEKLTVSKLSGFSKDIQQKIAVFQKDLNSQLKANLRKGIRMAVDHITDEIQTIQKGIVGNNIRLSIRASIVLSRSQVLLLNQYDASTARYAAELRSRISKSLSESALKRLSINDAVNKLASTKGLIRQDTYKIERIVRTEFNNAHNYGRLQSIEESKKILPDLKKRWDSTLDSRTSPICRHLDGTIVESNGFFKYGKYEFQTPPAHPNCRSAVTPYRDEWKQFF